MSDAGLGFIQVDRGLRVHQTFQARTQRGASPHVQHPGRKDAPTNLLVPYDWHQQFISQLKRRQRQICYPQQKTFMS